MEEEVFKHTITSTFLYSCLVLRQKVFKTRSAASMMRPQTPSRYSFASSVRRELLVYVGWGGNLVQIQGKGKE